MAKIKINTSLGFLNQAPKDREIIKGLIKTLCWKDEGSHGPIWLELDYKIPNNGFFGPKKINATINYQDDTTLRAGSTTDYYAQWFTKAKAKQIAQQLSVKFEEG